MKTVGNILWHFPFFGFVSALLVYAIGLLLTLTVVAAPIGLGLMELGKFLFFPFGHSMVSKADLNIQQNKAWGAYSTVVTIIYLPFGILLAVCAAIQVFLLFCSIFGIPVALVVAKSLGTYLNPVNKKCVSSAVASELERRAGQQEVDKHLGPAAEAHTPQVATETVAAASATAVARAISASENSGLKTCPRCAEDVKRAAIVCRYCGFEFPPSKSGPTDAAPAAVELEAAQFRASSTPARTASAHGSAPPNGVVVGGAFILFVAVVVGAVSYVQSQPKVDPQVQEAILGQLASLVAQRGVALRNDPTGKDLIAKYLDYGGSPDMRVSSYSLVNVAAQSGYADLVKKLIDRGADLNLGRDGTPLYWSIVEGQHEAALILIRAGADVNLEKSGGWSPLDAAQRELDANNPRTKEVIQALLQKGAHLGSGNRSAEARPNLPPPVPDPGGADRAWLEYLESEKERTGWLLGSSSFESFMSHMLPAGSASDIARLKYVPFTGNWGSEIDTSSLPADLGAQLNDAAEFLRKVDSTIFAPEREAALGKGRFDPYDTVTQKYGYARDLHQRYAMVMRKIEDRRDGYRPPVISP